MRVLIGFYFDIFFLAIVALVFLLFNGGGFSSLAVDSKVDF